MAPGRCYYQILLKTVTTVETLQSTMMSASCHRKVILEMTPVQAVAAEAPARVAICLLTEPPQVEIGQATGDRNKPSILRDNHMFQLDMYPT